jgi:hypothetical protein
LDDDEDDSTFRFFVGLLGCFVGGGVSSDSELVDSGSAFLEDFLAGLDFLDTGGCSSGSDSEAESDSSPFASSWTAGRFTFFNFVALVLFLDLGASSESESSSSEDDSGFGFLAVFLAVRLLVVPLVDAFFALVRLGFFATSPVGCFWGVPFVVAVPFHCETPATWPFDFCVLFDEFAGAAAVEVDAECALGGGASMSVPAAAASFLCFCLRGISK